MAVVDTLITRITMDASGYKQGAAHVNAANAAMSKGGEVFNAAMGAVTGFVAVVGAAATALVGLGVTASKQAAEFDALIKALEQVEGSAAKAGRRYKELYEIAKAPGAGPEEALRGYLMLSRSGVGSGLSKDIIKEFANANAMGGGGREELQRMLLTASQVASKPFLQGEELLQFLEAGLPANRFVKQAFGTSDTDELKKRGIGGEQVLAGIVSEMAKLKRVGDSAKNTMENFGAAVKSASTEVGRGLNESAIPYLQDFSTAIEKMVADGSFKALGDQLANISLAGAGSPRDALIELGAVSVDVAAALRNLALNIDDVRKAYSRPTGPGDGIPGQSDGTGPGFQSPGEAYRANAEQLDMVDEQAKRRAKKAGMPEGSRLGPYDATPAQVAAEEAKAKAEEAKAVTTKAVDLQSKQLDALRDIASNTGRSLDMQRGALGGGNIGSYGVTNVELAGMRAGMAGRNASRAINYGMHAIAQEYFRRGR